MSNQWVDRTARNEPVRIVKLMHLDGSVRSMRDDGCNQDGKPNQGRAHLLNMLAKRTTIPNFDKEVLDGVLAGKRPHADLDVMGAVKNGDGEIALVPVFRLAEPPPRFPFERLPERTRGTIQQNDVVDRSPPFRTGEDGAWAMPSPAWLAHSRAWCAWKAKEASSTRAMLEDATRASAGEALEKLMKIASKRGGGTSVSA